MLHLTWFTPMIYTVEMRTEDAKTSVKFDCNDYDKAIIFFRQCVNAQWDIIGDLQITLTQNVGHNKNEITDMYKFVKNY